MLEALFRKTQRAQTISPQFSLSFMRKSPNVIFRLLTPKAKREKDDSLLLHEFDDCKSCLPSNTSGCNVDEDDTSSISSFSTTATADNIPGAGRTVDMFFYQPVGRWIERLAMRLAISSLNPDQILRYIEAKAVLYYFLDAKNLPLHDAINTIRGRPNGPTIFAGLKTLVKQTQ